MLIHSRKSCNCWSIHVRQKHDGQEPCGSDTGNHHSNIANMAVFDLQTNNMSQWLRHSFLGWCKDSLPGYMQLTSMPFAHSAFHFVPRSSIYNDIAHVPLEIIHTTRESSRCQNLDICMLWLSELLTQRLQRPSHQRQWSSHSRASTMQKDLAVKSLRWDELYRYTTLHYLAICCCLFRCRSPSSISESLPKRFSDATIRKTLQWVCQMAEAHTAYFEVALNAKKVMVSLTPRWIAWKA